MRELRQLLVRSVRSDRWWVVLPVLVLALGAYQHRWMTDDGFINLRIVRQIQAGHGPVFNIGERVETGTSILWLLLLVVFDALLPFRLEHIAAYGGIALSLVGLGAIATAAQRLARRVAPSDRLVPVGALALSVVAAMWDFSSSGLESGLQFAWLGVSLLLLTRASGGSARRVLLTGVVVGLGPLVRPDLALFAIAFVVALLLARPFSRRRVVSVVAASSALPLAYQVFRMGFFATVVPNTALAKNASGLRVGQGLRYLHEALASYWMWPIVVAVPVIGVLVVGRPLRRRADASVVVMWCAGVSALLHLGYIVVIGGDYMHARLLLPSLFVLLGLVAVPLPRAGAARAGRHRRAVGAFAVWALACAFVFRSDAASIDGIINEHTYYTGQADTSNPITIDDYRSDRFTLVSVVLAAGDDARAAQSAGIVGLLGDDLARPSDPYPQTYYLLWPVVGMAGYVAGVDVFVLDQLGLGDPVVSRLDVPFRSRPGHEKNAPGWAVARIFPDTVLDLTVVDADGVSQSLDREAVQRILRCPAVQQFNRDISAPLTIGRFIGNLVHAVPNTLVHLPYMPTADTPCP